MLGVEAIILIFFAAYVMACTIRFIDFGMSKGVGPLGVYYKWLCRVSELSYKRNEEGEDEILSVRWYYYPLGGCLHCFGFWASCPSAYLLAVVYGNTIQSQLFIFIAVQAITFRFTENQEKDV